MTQSSSTYKRAHLGPSVVAAVVTFIYSDKATKFCEISTVDLSFVVPVRPTIEISQNFAAFSDYINFKGVPLILSKYIHVSTYYVSTMWPFTTQERVTL